MASLVWRRGGQAGSKETGRGSKVQHRSNRGSSNIHIMILTLCHDVMNVIFFVQNNTDLLFFLLPDCSYQSSQSVCLCAQ